MAHQNSKGRIAFVHPYGPESQEKLDTMPSDKQPPGVDEEPQYESLEEALTS
jgi:hypothetical protein